VGPTADVNIMEKVTSLPLSEFETRFSGRPFRRLVAVFNVLSLFINVCISKLKKQTDTDCITKKYDRQGGTHFLQMRYS